MMEVAVLIPTYKPGKYFERCLESLNNQTLSYDRFRVYIALNGPEKKFKKYVEELLKENSFEYKFIHLPKPGVSNARNHLIEISSEPYITFVDDDDVLTSNYLEELLLKSSEDIMAISNVKSFTTDLNQAFDHYVGNSYSKMRDFEKSKVIARKYYSNPCAKMLHRNMIGNIRFNEKLALGEDSLFMAQVSTNIKGTIKTENNACYFVYVREGSASRTKRNRVDEIKRIAYLSFLYSKLLVRPDSDKLFMTTRILATLKHLTKII